MKREIAGALILGCLLILLIQVPSVARDLRVDLEGPYGGWEAEGSVLAEQALPPMKGAGALADTPEPLFIASSVDDWR